MHHKVIRKSLAQVLSLLDSGQSENHPRKYQNGHCGDPDILKKVIVSQGVGPYLYHITNQKQTLEQNSPDLVSWLYQQYEINALRIQNLHADLEVILSRANKMGIPIMPLKGSLLTAYHYSLPAIRPMADIDLLVKPDDYPGLKSILESSGYRLIKMDTGYANHSRFLRPGNAHIISREAEHPDNPRPVEVHTELRRPLFGKQGALDLTDLLWKDAYTIEIFNQEAVSPSLEALFINLAVHAAGHLFTQTGRLIQWLDLAFVYKKINFLPPTEFPDRIFFPLKLASRAFPTQFENSDLSLLEGQVHPRTIKWATHIPLDDRCGLTINFHGPQRNKMRLRLLRWRPVPWKISMAYGTSLLPFGYIRYFLALIGRANRLLKIR